MGHVRNWRRTFSLHAIPAEIAKNIEIASPPTPREEHPVKLIFEVKDVESECARLESLGIQLVRRPWHKPGEACDAVDPEGNVFQICSSGTDALLCVSIEAQIVLLAHSSEKKL